MIRSTLLKLSSNFLFVCTFDPSLGDDLGNLNVHIIAIVGVVGLWGLILGAQLFSLALYLVVLTFFVQDFVYQWG